jgi:hypothetical protein
MEEIRDRRTLGSERGVRISGDFVPFLGLPRISKCLASQDPETHDPNSTYSAEVPFVPESFPALVPALMTFFLIGGVILLALWLVETIVFLVGYRQSNSKSP